MKLRTLYRLPQISGIFVYTRTDLWFAGWRRGGFVAMPPRPQYKLSPVIVIYALGIAGVI